MIYKTVQPWDIRPGDRVSHLGSLRTVESARPCDDELAYYIAFLDGLTALVTNELSIVDEKRTDALLQRYTDIPRLKRRAG